MQDLKTSSPIAAKKLHQHLHKTQGFPRTSTLENLTLKPLKNVFKSFFSLRKD